ncbi:EcsC family protein [Histidinibacterium lentulum]|uniref:Protein EcsC n=1 Tax=Histidinibacterium lentulum TaxID=2480588 RepID=A0A3N2R7P2_9RHOB|nr:EcsC family protein [Histidinibacterium lentulum]ROU03500.1 protein EcsC [Histidinibacterium lentulum]
MDEPNPLREINPEPPPVPLDEAARAEIAALVDRQRRARGLLMQVITFAGGQVEDAMKRLPKGARGRINEVARTALERSYEVASGTGGRWEGDRANKAFAALSGALGGLGGLPTALAELPVATTVIFRAVQGVAAQNGEDPRSVETRLECLRVFGSGGPGEEDDGIDTSFLGARLSLTGPAVHRLIAAVAPRFAAVLGQKLAAGAVPLIGAAAGAGTNYAFIDYYVEMAHVHFGLRRLARGYGEAQVLEEFHKVLAERSRPAVRAG